MNGCTINSKDRCRESGAHGVAKNLLFTQVVISKYTIILIRRYISEKYSR